MSSICARRRPGRSRLRWRRRKAEKGKGVLYDGPYPFACGRTVILPGVAAGGRAYVCSLIVKSVTAAMSCNVDAYRVKFPVVYNEGKITGEQAMNVEEFFAHWLEEYIRPHRKLSTYIKYRDIARCHICRNLGKFELADLSAQAVQAFVNDMVKAGLAYNTISGIVSACRGIRGTRTMQSVSYAAMCTKQQKTATYLNGFFHCNRIWKECRRQNAGCIFRQFHAISPVCNAMRTHESWC